MSSIKFTFLSALLFCGLLMSCTSAVKPVPGSMSYVAIINSLDVARAGSLVVKSDAVRSGDKTGCIVSSVVSTGLESAVLALSSTSSEIPATSVNISECLNFDAMEGTGADPRSSNYLLLFESLTNSVKRTSEFYFSQTLEDPSKCRKGVTALAVINYLDSLLGVVVSEVESPTGSALIPGTKFDYSSCGEFNVRV